jgi:hypothetical protein
LTLAKLAVSDLALVIGTLHAAVPVQAPLQPVNAHPFAAVLLNCTMVSDAKSAAQIRVGQMMPTGLLVTVPFPLTKTDSL